jgi:threonine dehydrogenase-like Zn-dependent dehydrogenase
MLGLVTSTGRPGTTRVAELPDARVLEGEVLVRPLEVGVCGTDREIAAGIFGVGPPDGGELVLGHELLGVVERDGSGFTRGQLVTATVRRSCRRCIACLEGSPDSCLSGDYAERGITRLHGFAREVFGEDPNELIAIPQSLGRIGVLAEPASVCERALRHARAIGGRQPWELARTLVVGAGTIGMLATYRLRLDGLDVWTAALEPAGDVRAQLVEVCGAHYVSTNGAPLGSLGDELGSFDLVVEATGDAQAAVDAIGMLGRSGVCCLLGIDPRDRTLGVPGSLLSLDVVIGNRVVFGSVNARRGDWGAAVEALAEARTRWPDALGAFVGIRAPLDRFQEAFDHRGIKATLVLSEI